MLKMEKEKKGEREIGAGKGEGGGERRGERGKERREREWYD